MADTQDTEEKPEGQAGPAIEGGAYDIIRARLVEHGKALGEKADALNAQRVEVFGGIEMSVLGNERIRTENNCIPRDIVQIGGLLLFGYNVFVGLRKEIKVGDVFSVHRMTSSDGGFDFESVPLDAVPWLSDPGFVKDFTELYNYYKESRLAQIRMVGQRLLAVFQIGDRIDDVKAFRWAVSPDGDVTYIDNRGHEDHVFPATHDFEWKRTGRDNFILGRHPHVNILDEVFVETVGGDLTVKVEDNTEDGAGIYSEAVDDKNQSLDDAQIFYAKLGTLILLKVLPYREETWRYFVFNIRTQRVDRIDAIGHACVQLPEDHGIIFPGGYYLQAGDTKSFDGETGGLQFLQTIRSPNGEDVLYLFYRESDGTQILLPYNLIRKAVDNVIQCHGHAFYDDGKLVIFRADEDPTRVHHMRIWQTAFMSEEQAAALNEASEHAGSFLVKVGNAELVRGVSDAKSIQRSIGNQQPNMALYEDLIRYTTRVIDAYHWLDNDEVGNLLVTLQEILKTAELVIDEFEKVLTIQKAANAALDEAKVSQDKLFDAIRPDLWETVDHFVDAMGKLRTQRGHLITLREMRYMDIQNVDAMEAAVSEKFDFLSEKATEFLLQDDALKPYHDRNDGLMQRIDEMAQASESPPIYEDLDLATQGLDVLTEVISGLKMDDASARTSILEGISEIFGLLNRTRATLDSKRKELLYSEGVAEFGAQFKLYTQSVQSALGLSDSPEKCEEQLTRLMVQLEELEGRFSEFDEFLGDLATKRNEVYDAFSAKKQTLLEARQRRASNLAGAAERILQGVGRRAQTFKELDELNAYFASDNMILKVRDITDQLMELGDTVKAEEINSQLKKARDDASRQLRDKTELFAEGDNVIRFGKHLFSVNTQDVDLTIIPREGDLYLHLTGTGFFEKIKSDELEKTRRYWDQPLISEDKEVYRGEYLAACILFDADAGRNDLSLGKLHEAERDEEGDGLLKLVRGYAANRYEEGYDRGVHDQDATLILQKVLSLYETAGLLRFDPDARGYACLFWAHFGQEDCDDGEDAADLRALWRRKSRSLGRLRHEFMHSPAIKVFAEELSSRIRRFLDNHQVDYEEHEIPIAGDYLLEELAADGDPRFSTSAEAEMLRDAFLLHLDNNRVRDSFLDDLRQLESRLDEGWEVAYAWMLGFLKETDKEQVKKLEPLSKEAVVLMLTDRKLDRETSGAMSTAEVQGLLGQHPRVTSRTMTVRLDEFLARLRKFTSVHVPGFRNYKDLRVKIAEGAKEDMRLSEFEPRVLSSFVRNKLINEVYLPMVGDNLAKQMGALGDKKRTDLMGLLLLISPPGYGKTTLMEYIANRLGLVFMKVNGPSLGHEVTSLDPEEAPNATARQEVEKINLSFEMGNNVLLYLDDIQHTNPEFLQKFISLCDGTRRIEGVWKGKTRTYDLRGKKFAVVMAGNPYTETGEKFTIPDMLANRADTYNLGDVLGGKEDVFALSYVENSLTSNAVLQPLANRSQDDVYLFVRMAKGEEIPTSDLKHGYSAVEVEEITNVLQKLFACQQVVLKVNEEYIRSAAQDDKYRTEPPFKLQGSYRNMNKLSEKVVAVMNEDELQTLIDDHYQGESQTLTTGAENNLLKLGELRNRMTDERRERWTNIKKEFSRSKMMGGDASDPVGRVTNTLSGLGQQLAEIAEGIGDAVKVGAEERAVSTSQTAASAQRLLGELGGLKASLDAAATAVTGGVGGALTAQAHATEKRAEQQGDLIASELQTLRTGFMEAAQAIASGLKSQATSQQKQSATTSDVVLGELRAVREAFETAGSSIKSGVERAAAFSGQVDEKHSNMLTQTLTELKDALEKASQFNVRAQLQAAETEADAEKEETKRVQIIADALAERVGGIQDALQKLDHSMSGDGDAGLSSTLAGIQKSMSDLAQRPVEITMPAYESDALKASLDGQRALVESTLVPLLQSMQSSDAAPAKTPPPRKGRSKATKAEAPTGPAVALATTAQLDNITAAKIEESLETMRRIEQMISDKEIVRQVYRPFAPKGTFTEED